MKRFFAILLTAILLLPLCFAAIPQKAHAETVDDIWAAIEAYEDARFSEQQLSAKTATEQDYSALCDGVIRIVEDWNGFVPGSLVRNGDFFIWDGVDGVGYGYSPRMRKIDRAKTAPADSEAYDSVESVSYEIKGGSPSCGDVTLFGPYYGLDSSFTDQYKNEARSIAQTLGSNYTCYQKYDVNIDVIADALESSGVVIFDSHGSTDYSSGNDYTSRANTSYLCINSTTGITSQDTATVTGPYGSYKHALVSGSSAFIDGTAIKNHMNGTAPNSLLWMAICLGMATDGMEAPMREMGVEVVYGYSQSVTFSGDYKWEEYFWNKMKAGSEVQEAIAYMKQKVGVKDPYTSSYPAYPIVVSSEDAYPGHGNVDKTQTVYSSWTLFPQFTVTALSNDTSLGTVSVPGTTITATPKTGCAVVGYEVLSGSATVTQNGDGLSETRLSIRAQTDCTVRVDFAKRAPVSVTFVTPNGVSCGTINGYLGDTVSLPKPEGTPAYDAQSYLFYGWTEARVPDTDTRPDCFKAGEPVKILSDRTFYALYSYATDNGATIPAGSYLLLFSEPADWTGDAVLTYDGRTVLSSDGTASSVSTASAAVSLGNAGIEAAGDLLSNVSESYLYEIASVGNGKYTLRMKGADDLYLCYYSSGDKLSATKKIVVSGGKSAAYWRLTYEQGHPVFTNDQTASATLCFDTAKQCFTCKKNNAGEPLTVYMLSNQFLMYTTELQNASELPELLYGDANCDGSITAADAALILRTLVGLDTLTEVGTANADVDGSGSTDASDAALILRHVVKLIDHFPAEE